MKAAAKQLANTLIRFAGSLTASLQQIKEIEVAPAQSPVIQPAPSNMSLLPLSLQQQFAETVERPRKVVYYCSDVSVSWNGIVMKGLELFKPSLAYPAAWDEFSGTYLLRQWLVSAKQPVITGSKKLALVHDFWSVNNYYHWLADVLPRLLVLQQLHPDCVLLLPEGASSYMLLSAQALGFATFHFTPKNRVVRGIDIVMPGHTAAVGRQDRLLLRQVRQQLLNVFAPAFSTLKPKRRVFASRRTQRTRRLLNEEELLPLLEQYNIETVLFDGMTLPQQIELMQSVDLFIGVHGANMTNLVFLQPITPVIELMDAEHPNLCYFNMAANLSLPYQVVPCEGVVETSVHENNYNLRVDLGALKQALICSMS